MIELICKGSLVCVGLFSIFIIEKYYRKKELIEIQLKLIRIIDNLESKNEEITEKNSELINGCREHYVKIDEYLKHNKMK